MFVAAIGIVLLMEIGSTVKDDQPVGGLWRVPTFTSASSTVYTIGNQLSTQVLASSGGRSYAILCNTGSNRAYINFGTALATGTTTQDVSIATNSCYEIDQDNLFTGVVTAIQDTSSSTATFIVTEFTGS